MAHGCRPTPLQCVATWPTGEAVLERFEQLDVEMPALANVAGLASPSTTDRARQLAILRDREVGV